MKRGARRASVQLPQSSLKSSTGAITAVPRSQTCFALRTALDPSHPKVSAHTLFPLAICGIFDTSNSRVLEHQSARIDWLAIPESEPHAPRLLSGERPAEHSPSQLVVEPQLGVIRV